MCIILDECVMLIVLAFQALSLLPSIAVSRETGLALLALYLVTALVSICFAFLYTFRDCCSCVDRLQRWGSKIFYLLHLCLFALSLATISNFLEPFFSKTGFAVACKARQLDMNLSSTSCEKLEGFMVIALMALTLCLGLSVYMLLIGRRIAKKHAIEYNKLQREKILEDAELPSLQKQKKAATNSARNTTKESRGKSKSTRSTVSEV
jgi:hypothetical protein